MAVFTWEDPYFWKTDSSRVAINTTTSSGGAPRTSNKKEQSPDLKPSPTSAGDTGKISKLIASHGVFKMDNPLSKATSPLNQNRNPTIR